MAIPSTDRMRGLKDGIGFPTTAEAMAAVYAASALPPQPAPFGPAPPGPVVGAIAPHDDYLYAGRVLRRALERIEANTVVIVGTFHRYRDYPPWFGWFDTRETWWTPDGPVRVSPLREEVARRLGPLFKSNDAAHDQEHSIEPIVAWLRHKNPRVEILPILAPGTVADGLLIGANMISGRLKEIMSERGLELGKDVAIVISADAIHYGADFAQTRYGEGGPDAYEQAVAEDRRLLRRYLSGELGMRGLYEFFCTLVDESDVDRYLWTWCGRFAIPFGFAMLDQFGADSRLIGSPLAYETSMSAPPLDVSMPPLGFTAPASYEHFVGYPAVVFTFEPKSSAAET